MRPGDAACATEATPNLYMVTIKNLDGTTKTVLKSQPLGEEVSCYELTPDQINALWFAGQADLPGNRGPIPAIMRRRIALFVEHNSTDPRENRAFSKFAPQDIETLISIITTEDITSLSEGLKNIFQREQRGNYELIQYKSLTTQQVDELKAFLDKKNQKNLSAKLLSNSKKLVELDDEQKEQARRVALAIVTPSSFEVPSQTSPLAIPDHVLDAALNGDEAVVRRMLRTNAYYLLYRGTASDFSGRKYDNLTPFQAALITGDIEMAEMIKPFFARLENGEAEMQTQVVEIFPREIEKHEVAQKWKSETKFVPMLNELIGAINNAESADLQAALSLQDNQSKLCKALNTFRGAFTELSHSEKIFNPHYSLAAFEAYVSKFNWNNLDWNIHGWNKLDLFWRQVIGYVQRFLPATYAQAYAYSLYDIVENKHSYPRSFNFRHDSGFSFYPLSGSCSGLGFNFAEGERVHATSLCRRSAGGTAFSKLMSNKNNKLSELITPRAQSTHCCLIQ